jgi:hypothetical protein
MTFLRRGRNLSLPLLGIWLIATGALQLGVSFPFAGYIVAGLGIVAGVLILTDR